MLARPRRRTRRPAWGGAEHRHDARATPPRRARRIDRRSGRLALGPCPCFRLSPGGDVPRGRRRADRRRGAPQSRLHLPSLSPCPAAPPPSPPRARPGPRPPPGAQRGVGLSTATTRETLHRAALDGSMVDLCDWGAAHANEFVYNRAGTIHALGAGRSVVEVQQNVDCTYRLDDYGRPRELHLDAGLAVSETAPRPDARDRRVDPAENRLLVDGPHFHLLHLTGPEAEGWLPARKRVG